MLLKYFPIEINIFGGNLIWQSVWAEVKAKDEEEEKEWWW
jgi:hypothetical protein